MRKVRRLTRLLSVLPALSWAWHERHLLSSMAAFLRTVPDRVKLRRWGDLLLGARVHAALLRDQSLRGAEVRVGAVSDGSVTLVAPAGDRRAARARELVVSLSGVQSVLLDDAAATTTATTSPERSAQPTAVPRQAGADATPEPVGLPA